MAGTSLGRTTHQRQVEHIILSAVPILHFLTQAILYQIALSLGCKIAELFAAFFLVLFLLSQSHARLGGMEHVTVDVLRVGRGHRIGMVVVLGVVQMASDAVASRRNVLVILRRVIH